MSRFPPKTLPTNVSLQKSQRVSSCSDTSDTEHHGGLGRAQFALDYHLVLPVVLGPNPKDKQGAHSAHVGDVVVWVCVQADVVAVPRHSGHWIALHRAAHAALVALWSCALPQWDDK